jgi:lethal(2) giant larvae protein
MIIFAGGMPRSAYGDRQCVSVHCADGTKVAFDFTSKVIDFFVTYKDEDSDEVDVSCFCFAFISRQFNI